MSENDIERLLGALNERTENTNKQIEKLVSSLNTMKESGCLVGKENQKQILELQGVVNNFKGLGRKVILAMLSVSIGSVGLQKLLALFLTYMAQ